MNRFKCTAVVLISMLGLGPALLGASASAPGPLDIAVQDLPLTEELLHQIGEGLARSLEEPEMRRWLERELEASVYVEKRIALKRVLASQPEVGRALLERAGLKRAQWAAADRLLPELELYFPIEEDRELWAKSETLEVAVEIGDTESYVLYAARGESRTVDEYYLPTVPTLVLGPSEIDYDDLPSAVEGGSLTGSYLLARASHPAFSSTIESLRAPHQSVNPNVHSYLIGLRVWDDHESIFKGTAEFDFFGSVNGSYNECFTVTGLRENRTYEFADAPNLQKLARAAASRSVPLVLNIWENDKNRCRHHGKDDFVGLYHIFSGSTTSDFCTYSSYCEGFRGADASVLAVPAFP